MIYRSSAGAPVDRLALYANPRRNGDLRRLLLGNRWSEFNAKCRPL